MEDGSRRILSPAVVANGNLRPLYDMVGRQAKLHPRGVKAWVSRKPKFWCQALAETRRGRRIWSIRKVMLQQASGDQPYPEIIAEMSALVAALLDALEIAAEQATAIALPASMEDPDPKHSHIREAIAGHLAPILQDLLREHLKLSATQIPNPPGGRPQLRTAERKAEIVRKILSRIAAGLSPAEARRRIARETGRTPKPWIGSGQNEAKQR
jgi:hypothetical protein